MSNASHESLQCRAQLGLCRAALPFLFVLALFANPAEAQRERGELQIEVRDPQGQRAAATAELVSESNQVKKTLAVAGGRRYLASELAFGVDRLTITAQGFAPWSGLLEVRSEVPVRVAVVLDVATLTTKIEVSDAATILDPSEAGTIYSLGSEALREHVAAQAG